MSSFDIISRNYKKTKELYVEGLEIRRTMVRLLDDIGHKKILLNTLEVDGKTFIKIEHRNDNHHLHSEGVETIIYYRVGQLTDKDSLWNFMAGQAKPHKYKQIADILNYLIKRYPKNYKNIEDYELWTRIIYKNNIDNIGEMLIKYRIHDNQITKNNKKEMKFKGLFIRILALWRFIFKF